MMEDSLYSDITSRSLLRHASHEVPKYSTPLPVLQPPKQRSVRRRSALTVARPSVDPSITPRTLLKKLQGEKAKRKSSPPALRDGQLFQIQERPQSRRSLRNRTDLFDDISVDEAEITEERSLLPDIEDISAIVGGHKKPKLQLGKLDNRAYKSQTQRKRPQNRNQSPEEEEYEATSSNSEHSKTSFCQGSSRKRQSTSHIGPDDSLSDEDHASDVNFDTKAIQGSPLFERRKQFSEKQIPHLSSDSDATLLGFPGAVDERQKTPLSLQSKSVSHVLSTTHPLPSSSQTFVSPTSKRISSNNHSSVKTLSVKGKNILSQSLQFKEQGGSSPFLRQKAQTPEFASASRHGPESDADEEFTDEEDNDEDQNIPLVEKRGSTRGRSEMAPSAHKKSLSSSVQTQHTTGLMSLQRSHHADSEEENETTFNDEIQLVELAKVTISLRQNSVPQATLSKHAANKPAASELYNIASQENMGVQDTSYISEDDMLQEQQEQRISEGKITGASQKVGKLPQNTPSRISGSSKIPVLSGKKRYVSQTSLSQGSAKAASVSLPYNIVNDEGMTMHRTSHVSQDDDLIEESEDQNESRSADVARELNTPETAFSHQQKSASSSSGTHRTKSSSCKIINPPDIDMHGTPQVLADASYQVPDKARTSGQKSDNISRKSSHARNMSEPAQFTSPSLSVRSGLTSSIRNKMHSTAIPDHSAEILDDSLSQLHMTKVPSRKTIGSSRKTPNQSRTSEEHEHLTNTASPIRFKVADTHRKELQSVAFTGCEGTDETIQGSTPLVSESVSGWMSPNGEIPDRDSFSPSGKKKSKISGLAQFLSPAPAIRSRMSRSARKGRHSPAIHDDDASLETVAGNSSQIFGVSHWEPHPTSSPVKLTASASRKVSRPKRMSNLRESTSLPSSAESSVSGSTRKKMHSTATRDRTVTMAASGHSVSPIRKEWRKTSRSDEIHRRVASPVHTDSDEGAGSSVSSSSESEQSPDQVPQREITLPPSVHNHDQEPQAEDAVAGPSASPAAGRKKRRAAKTGVPPRIPAADTRKIFEHFSGMKLTKGALNTVMESCDIFWEQTYAALDAYAKHAGRDEIEMKDVELLLYRQGYAHDRNSLNALIARYMPMQYRKEVIRMATPNNLVIP